MMYTITLKYYMKLELLRYYFLKVPIIALFTILFPNILDYIRKSLYLYTTTCFYKQLLDCFKITQMVNTITRPKFKDLNFLISKARLIPKTIIFINNLDNRITLATCFEYLILLELYK